MTTKPTSGTLTVSDAWLNESLIKRVGRRQMLEMLAEIRTTRLGSWAYVFLILESRKILNDELGGMAGEW
ncbi:hypothetical protein ACVBGC_09440 [Burkholderia stagnalis]